MEEYNQRSRYQKKPTIRSNNWSENVSLTSQSVTIENNIYFFSVWSCWFVADDIWTRNENAICHWYTVGWMDFIEFEMKTAQLFVAMKFVEMRSLLLVFCVSLSLFIYLCSNRTQRGSIHLHWLASNRPNRRTHTRNFFPTHSNGDVLFTSQHSRRRFVVFICEDFVGRSMRASGIYSRSICHWVTLLIWFINKYETHNYFILLSLFQRADTCARCLFKYLWALDSWQRQW